jgi:gamma-glutamyltranspeptidase
LKREKYEMMAAEADKVIADSEKMRNDVYEEVKKKLALSRKARVKPGGIISQNKMAEKFNINVKTEQSSLTDEKVVMEY